MPVDRPVIVDWFGITPRDVAPLLSSPEHAVFLLPAKAFREQALRDELWVAEIRRQALDTGLPVVDVDGTRGPEPIADELAANVQSS